MGNLFECGNGNAKLSVTTLGSQSINKAGVGTKTVSWNVKDKKDYKKFTKDNFFPYLTSFNQFHGGSYPAGFDTFTTGNKRYDAVNGTFYYDVNISDTYHSMDMSFNCDLVQ